VAGALKFAIGVCLSRLDDWDHFGSGYKLMYGTIAGLKSPAEEQAPLAGQGSGEGVIKLHGKQPLTSIEIRGQRKSLYYSGRCRKPS